MNRETRFEGSDTLIVVERPNRRRWMILAAILVGVAALVLAYALYPSGGDAGQAAAKPGAAGKAGGRGGQMPTVSVIVPGRTEITRAVTASGALAARRDQPVGVAGEGGRVTAVMVDAGSWVRQGQTMAVI
ncbi:MAG: hypothetical protein Q8K85_09185, partial [Hyphomicrobium sp.]|nr:hypothetical protein [Hyphomicrobium sp.]